MFMAFAPIMAVQFFSFVIAIGLMAAISVPLTAVTMIALPGVFAIGDIRNTPFKQVVVAAADGCIAAMSIDRFLKGRKKVRVDWVHDL